MAFFDFDFRDGGEGGELSESCCRFCELSSFQGGIIKAKAGRWEAQVQQDSRRAPATGINRHSNQNTKFRAHIMSNE